MFTFVKQYEVSVPGKSFRSETPYIGVNQALKILNSSNLVHAPNFDDMRNLHQNLSSGQAVVRVNHGVEIKIMDVLVMKPIKLILDRSAMKKQQKEAAEKFAKIMAANNSILKR